MNIPARYCTGYLGDVGMPRYLSSRRLCSLVRGLSQRPWHMFDPRNNVPRIGRVLIARETRCGGCRHRDDVWPQYLAKSFRVWTDEVDKQLTRT